jgi:glycosyltransferase involved in cell wall biosynthesis
VTAQAKDRRGLIARLRRHWRERDLVTINVPAYNAADFIAATLQSIADQTYRNIRVVISLDPSTDDTETICQPFLADPRFTLIRQPARLGWPGNVNFLLDQVRSEYFCTILHDDLIEPRYIARLMRRLRGSAGTICAYPVVERFGAATGAASIASIEHDDRFERARQFFARPLHAVPLRGLTRTDALRRGLRLRELGTGGFLAEMLYVLELALLGNCRRVGGAVYRSRCRADSVSRGWRAWSTDRKRAGWCSLLRACRLAVARDFTPRQQIDLLAAMLSWAYQLPGWLPASPDERAQIAHAERRAALARRWAEDPEGKPPFL